MLNTQIATMLNNVLIPNYFGKGEDGSHDPITITEDLRNVVDLGKALTDLSVADLENFKGDLVVGVLDTYTDAREFNAERIHFCIDLCVNGHAVEFSVCIVRTGV